MSETLVQRPTLVPQPTRREVINVDDYVLSDDDDIQIIPRTVVHARPREVIVVDDSDEEVQEVPGPSRATAANATEQARRGPLRIHRRALFSPSPPPQDNIIPPVPPLPRHIHEPPLRWRVPPEFAGVFRPLDVPLAFEDRLPAHAHAHMPDNTHDLRNRPLAREAAPRSNMGLGGAIIALGRQDQIGRARPQVPEPQPGNANQHGWGFPGIGSGLGVLRRLFHVLDGSPEPAMPDDGEDAVLLHDLALDADERQNDLPLRFYPGPVRRADLGGQFNARDDTLPGRLVPSDYKQHFTHPAKPDSGFVNDFAPQDIVVSDGPSSTESGTILVCARCLDPLVMNVIGSEDVMRQSRLWALRCGHLLDGKCIEALMKPPPPPVQPVGGCQIEMDAAALPSKGKGKAKDVSPAAGQSIASGVSGLDVFYAMDQDHTFKKNRGKRKASAVEEDGSSPLPMTFAQPDRNDNASVYSLLQKSVPARFADDLGSHEQGHEQGRESILVPSAPLNSMRSRLRPRHPVGGSPSVSVLEHPGIPTNETFVRPSSVPSAPIASPACVWRGVAGSSRGRGGRARGAGAKGKGRGKGKAKAAAPVIQAEHGWLCPVAGCAHNHKSVLVNGEWHMDEVYGAIAVYV